MKELENKMEELELELKALESIKKDIANDIEEFKEKKEDYLGAEITYNRYKEKIKYTEKKISVINDAIDILNGIGI